MKSGLIAYFVVIFAI